MSPFLLPKRGIKRRGNFPVENDSGTNRNRIADSRWFRICSLRYVVCLLRHGTKSWICSTVWVVPSNQSRFLRKGCQALIWR